MNTSFSTTISNLNIPEYSVPDPISNDINDPVLKSILKYKDHPSLKVIEKITPLNSLFKLSNVEKREMRNEIVNLDTSKLCQDTDYQQKLLKRVTTFLQTLLIQQLIRLSIKTFQLF